MTGGALLVEVGPVKLGAIMRACLLLRIDANIKTFRFQ